MGIITISGTPGSGKSTVGKILAEKLGYEFFSIGKMRRKMADERGITLEELNKLGEKEDFTDKEVDNYQKEIGKTKDDLVIEGRTSWYFIPNSFKVFLETDLNVAGERILKDIDQNKRLEEQEFKTIDEVVDSLKKRMESDSKRYKKYYGKKCDYLNKKNYDLVIDSTNLAPEAVAIRILEKFKKYTFSFKKEKV